MQEIWKDVVGYEGLYMVSNYGRIKTVERDCFVSGKNHHTLHINERILPVSKFKNGYLNRTLSKNGITKTYKVHRLVARAFLGEPLERQVVNHKDHNRSNNRLDNLEYVTHKENIKDMWEFSHNTKIRETAKRTIKFAIEKNKKKVNQYSKDGTYIKTWESITDASIHTKANISHISQCCNGQRKSSGGYVWRFTDEKK